MDTVDRFVEHLIRELCEGCTECEPRLPAAIGQPQGFACCTEGKVKWLMSQAERFKGETNDKD